MSAHRSDRHDAKRRSMANKHCPNCGSGEVSLRKVNDLFRAVDPLGKVFEVGLQSPVWSCRACRLCWQGQEAIAAKEAAYQHALARRSPSRMTA